MAESSSSGSDLSSTEDESSELESSFDNTGGLERVTSHPRPSSSYIDETEDSPIKSTQFESPKKVQRRKKTIRASPVNQTSSESSSDSEDEEYDSIENPETEETGSIGINRSSLTKLFQRDSGTKQKRRSRSRSPLQRVSRSRSRSPIEEVSNNSSDDCNIRNKDVERDYALRGELVSSNNNVQPSSQTFAWVGPKRASKDSVWKHWGFKSYPNKPADYSKVFCKHCNHCINYKSSSTNMKTHMNRKHQNLMIEVGVTQPKAAQYFVPQQARKEKYPKQHPINRRSRAALVKWFCKKDRPFKMSEDIEFAEFCEILDPKFELPSRMTVTRDTEATFKVEKEKLMKKLKRVDFLHGTNDGGSGINGESFVSNTVHYVDPDTWELKHAVLGCTVMKEAHTAKNYRKHVDATEESFDLKGKVLGYTTDNESKMHCAFRNDERNGCMAHIQSKSMEKAVNAVSCIALLRKKLRKLASLNKFPKFKYALKEAQKKRNLPNRKVLQEVKTRFTSTLTMCHSVMSYDIDPDVSKEEKAKKAKLNVEAINDALKNVGSKKAKKLLLKDSDVDKIVAISQVLEPICNMLTMLGGENYVTGSIVLPYCKKVVYLVKVEDTDPKFIVDFKNFIIKDFLKRCRDNLNFDQLKLATFLDPRFKSLKSLEPSQRTQLFKEIKTELKSLTEPEVKSMEGTSETKSVHKKKKITLESDEEEDDSEDISAEKELENYINEPKLHEDSDPLVDFWKNQRFKYPRMSVLAKKYLCIQATSTPSERVFSKLGNLVTKKRNRITPTHTNETIFLANVL